MIKLFGFLLIVLCVALATIAQPGNGNGNANGHGNGNGSGNCGNPPCGGASQNVPLDSEWLMLAGIVTGLYLKIKSKKKNLNA
jgi:hypothetical protein